MRKHPIYGLMAEFKTPEDLLAAAHAAQEAGYRRMDAFTPLPVEGLAEAVGFHRTRLRSTGALNFLLKHVPRCVIPQH